MKFLKSSFAPVIIVIALVSFQACKSKKLIQKPAPVAQTPPPPVQQAPPPPPQPPAPVAQTPPPVNVNTVKIQFEFDSGILTTDSYPLLDQVAASMKMNPSSNFVLNGYASIEGTPEHNMKLSEDRANAVKVYLVNGGVSAANISTKGYGTANPLADNNTEEGKVLNRRVEFRKLN